MTDPTPDALVRPLTVGGRVVVRHRLPDGSATDALGDLLADDEGSLRIATRRGEVVVARADVLAAKPVPPPPARKGPPHTAIGTEDLERVMAEHWRPLERVDLGGWRLRASEGFTGRANSALALGDPGLPLREAVAAVVDFHTSRGLQPLVAVAHPDGGLGEGTALVDLLAATGWTVRTPTVVLTAATDDLPGAAEVPLPAGLRVETSAEPDDAWLERYHYQGLPTVPPAGRRILVSADEQVFVRIVDLDGRRDDGGDRARVPVPRLGRGDGRGDAPLAPAPRPRPAGAGRGRGLGALARRRVDVPAGAGRQRGGAGAVRGRRVHRPPRLPLPGRAAALSERG